MPAMLPTFRAWLELSRLSNLPTVITNVLVGLTLGRRIVIDYAPGEAPSSPVVTFAFVLLSMMLLYIGGMALNDVVDAAEDRENRPERVIPSGRISRRGALAFSVSCMLIALGLMATRGMPAFIFTAALVVAIVLYDLTHKRRAGSVVLMGLCRSLVYITAACAAHWTPELETRSPDWTVVAPPASAIFLYIVLLTIIARMEAMPRPGPRAWLALILPLPAFAVIAAIPPASDRMILPIVCGVTLFIWLTHSSMNVLREQGPRGTIAAVHGWLAGICLIDAWFLALLDEPWLVVACLVCFIITVLGHRRIMGA